MRKQPLYSYIININFGLNFNFEVLSLFKDIFTIHSISIFNLFKNDLNVLLN